MRVCVCVYVCERWGVGVQGGGVAYAASFADNHVQWKQVGLYDTQAQGKSSPAGCVVGTCEVSDLLSLTTGAPENDSYKKQISCPTSPKHTPHKHTHMHTHL